MHISEDLFSFLVSCPGSPKSHTPERYCLRDPGFPTTLSATSHHIAWSQNTQDQFVEELHICTETDGNVTASKSSKRLPVTSKMSEDDSVSYTIKSSHD